MTYNPASSHAAGAAIVRGPYSFAYNTAGLTNGVSFYTPTVGEILLGGSIYPDTLWDGTTPKGDIGTFSGTNVGLLSTTGISTGGLLMDSPPLGPLGTMDIVSPGLCENGNFYVFTTTAPLKVVVSQNGQKGGADPGSAQGAARIWIITAAPVAL